MDDYKTKDFHEAAFLMASGLALKELEVFADTGDRKVFMFLFNDSAEARSQNFWSGVAMVNARKFSMALKELKDRMRAKN